MNAPNLVNEEDIEFLNVLRKLESNDHEFDEDSILAPLGQKDEKTEVILSQKFCIQTKDANSNPKSMEYNYLDEDDDLLNEFSMNLIDLLPHDDT